MVYGRAESECGARREFQRREATRPKVSKPAVTTQAGGVIGVTGKEDFKIGKGVAKFMERPERVKTLKA